MSKKKPIKWPLLILILIPVVAMGIYMTLPRVAGKQIPTSAADLKQHHAQNQKSAPNKLTKDQATVENFYNDNFGSTPVAADFDSEEGALCGNGKSYYWTSKPPQKPIPASWSPPPPIGSDPTYQGPDPLAEIKESPYAMPSSKAVLRRDPIKDIGERRFVRAMERVLSKNKTMVGVLSEQSSLPDKLLSATGNLTFLDPAPFELGNEKDIFSSLKDKGIRYLLIDRQSPRVAPWVEQRLDSLRIRLRDGHPLMYFRPLIIGTGYSLYELQQAGTLSQADQEAITRYIRAKLGGRSGDLAPPKALVPTTTDIYRAIISLRYRGAPSLKGRKLARKIGRGESLQLALDKSINKLLSSWSRTVSANKKLYGVSLPDSLQSILPKLQIEVDVLQDLTEITDLSLRRLHWYYELGIHGIALHMNNDFYYLEPSYAIHREKKTAYQFLLKLLTRSRLEKFVHVQNEKPTVHTQNWFSDYSFRMSRFRTIHWVENLNGDIVPLYRGVPNKRISSVSRKSILTSLKLGADWLLRNQSDDGQYAYKYTPLNKPGRRWAPGGNIVRHALNPYSLLLVNSLAPDPALVQSARKGIDFTLKFLREQEGRCVICHRDTPARYYNAKIGSNAVAMLSILKLAETESIEQYRKALDCLAEELLVVQDPNGHFRQYDVPVQHPYYGAENTIAPGEIILALARMYAYSKDNRYLEAAQKAVPYYMKQWRHMVARKTPDGIYNEEDRMNIVGIIPWMTMSFNDLHRETGNTEYADLAFEMQKWIDKEVFYSISRSAYPDYMGAAFKTHRELPAINACQFTEGSSAAFEIAKRINRDVDLRRDVVLLGARFCIQLQYDAYASMYFTPVPEDVIGGYRYHLGVLRLRNDYSYHAISALAQSAEFLREEDYSSTAALEERIPEYFKNEL